MRWLEISVTTDDEAAEAVAELFNRYNQGRTVVEIPLDCFEHELPAGLPPTGVVVKTYLPLDDASRELQHRLEEGLWHLGRIYPIPEPVTCEIREEEWAESWKKQYHLLRVGRRTVLVPAWEEYTPMPGEVVVLLEPGMAFGTGLHPTTRHCLQALEEHLIPGSTVLDVGTGSGVLAIAAAKQGARSVLALDVDLSAVDTALQNVAMNGVAHQVTVRHGSLPGGEVALSPFATDAPVELLDTGQFDLALVNILASVIVGMAPALAARLTPAGRMIASGLIDSQEQSVVDALSAQGFRVIERIQDKDWVTLVAQRE